MHTTTVTWPFPGSSSIRPMGQQYESFVLWAVGIGDPCAREDVFRFWRDQVEIGSPQVGELLAAVAAALPADDMWRTLDESSAGSFAAWWDDCFPGDDDTYWGARLAPVPTENEVAVIRWAFTQPMFAAAEPPSTWRHQDVEWAVRSLLARFRTLEPGIDIREFLLDCAQGAWDVVERRAAAPAASPEIG